MERSSEQRVYEFDDFLLDAGNLMLYRNGEPVPLVPKAAKTLLALVERRGEIVGKDELLEAVWPDTTVEESNLFSYLTLLRKTLGNQQNGQPYLETFRRRGYRFNGSVFLRFKEPRSASEAVTRESQTQPSTEKTNNAVGFRYVFAISLFGILAAVALAAAFYWRNEQVPEDRSQVPTAPEKEYTSHAEAQRYFEAGRYNVYKIGGENIRQGIAFYEKAVIADPNYALAYAEMADAYRRLASAGFARPKEVCPKAREFAEKAMELDGTLAEAHITLGWIDYMYDWDSDSAEVKFKKAIDLRPNNSDAHFAYAHFLSDVGRHDEAVREIRRARSLRPTVLIIIAVESMILNAAGREDDAVVEAKKGLDLDQNFWPAHLQLGLAYYRQGRLADAERALEKARELEPGAYQALSSLGLVYAVSGDRKRAYAILKEMEDPTKYFPFHKTAAIYNGLGQRDKALDLLEQALEERETHLFDIRPEKSWDNLRADPRFIGILQKLNLNN